MAAARTTDTAKTTAGRFAALMKDALKSYLFDGILLIILGLVLVIWPDTSLSTFCAVAGVVLAVMGLVKLVFYLANVGGIRRWVDIPVGLVQFLLGCALVIWPAFFINLFQIVVGIVVIYGSLLLIIRAVQLRTMGGSLFVLSIIFGILTLALGVVIIMNPAQFASVMVQLMGVALIVEGIALVAVMHTAKKRVNEVEKTIRDLERSLEAEAPETIVVEGVDSGRASRGDVAYDDVRAETRDYEPAARGGRTEYYGR